MRLALRWLGWPVAVAVVGYFIWFAFRTFRLQDLSSLATPKAIVAILVAACLYALIIPISGAAWMILLRRQGEAWSPARLASILAVTQLAKYIPGGIAQPVGRAAMSVRHGMALRAFTVTVIQESVLAIAASIVVGVSLLSLSPLGIAQLPAGYRNIVFLGAAAAGATVLLFASGATWLPRWVKSRRWLSTAFLAIGPAPGISTTLVVSFAYCLNYLAIGLGVWAIGQALGLGVSGNYGLLTGAFSLAWLLGFVVPGAPAGLGVREGTMTLLLAHAVPQYQILVLVVAVRIATFAGDGICFAVGYWGARHMDRETHQ